MSFRKEAARPSCRNCWGTCHPSTARVIGDHPHSTEVPDHWEEPIRRSPLSGIYCSSKCVVEAWGRYQQEIDLSRDQRRQEEEQDRSEEDYDEDEDDWSL